MDAQTGEENKEFFVFMCKYDCFRHDPCNTDSSGRSTRYSVAVCRSTVMSFSVF